MIRRAVLLLFLASLPLPAQTSAVIRIDTAARQGPLHPVWNYFGYDEPNYTYMPHGRELVSWLAAASPVPVHIRAHHLLCTGDGTPALKWGSTNAYTEDAQGRPVYDWTIVDRIFDTYLKAGAKPFVEIGFMPEALSTHPQPYTRHWPKPDDGKGWSYPPRDYEKWGNLIAAWARHSAERFGKAEAESWYWEVWNEPDISYWLGTPEEYFRLYDTAVRAVKRELPRARVGGPATTGPASAKAARFLREFLEYTRRNHSPLDFVSFHAKGQPRVVDGHVRMGLQKNLDDAARGFDIVVSFPEYRSLPIVLTETDPEGCAACSARVYPQNAYRNGPLYASYTAAAFAGIERLARQKGANLEGLLTWAFEFEDQPYFDGFRTLATNGIAKPVLNLFRMFGQMGGDRLNATAQGAPGVDVVAARQERRLTALVWNYQEDDIAGPGIPVDLTLTGANVSRALLRHFRIDERHSNAWTVWKQMGSPQSPSPEQLQQLVAAGELQLLESPQWVDSRAPLNFTLPRNSVSLLEWTW